MLGRRVRNAVNLLEMMMQNYAAHTKTVSIYHLKHSSALYSTGSTYTELPRKLKKSERKPWVTSVNELKRKARLLKKDKQLARERILRPPENGLLVKELIPVAHQVYAARAKLYSCVSMVVKSINIYSCSVCGEVHVGDPPHKIRTCNMIGSLANREHSWMIGGMENVFPLVECFHLYDRLGRAVSHNEQLQVDRIPAIVELCIQGGVDVLEYPKRRRAFPAYSVAGKIIDFEHRFPKEEDAPGKDKHWWILGEEKEVK